MRHNSAVRLADVDLKESDDGGGEEMDDRDGEDDSEEEGEEGEGDDNEFIDLLDVLDGKGGIDITTNSQGIACNLRPRLLGLLVPLTTLSLSIGLHGVLLSR